MVNKTCDFAGCDKRVHAKSLCKGHYSQTHRGLALSVLRSRSLEDSPDGKTCTICKQHKPLDAYYKVNGTRRRSRCKRCFIELQTEINARNKDG